MKGAKALGDSVTLLAWHALPQFYRWSDQLLPILPARESDEMSFFGGEVA